MDIQKYHATGAETTDLISHEAVSHGGTQRKPERTIFIQAD